MPTRYIRSRRSPSLRENLAFLKLYYYAAFEDDRLPCILPKTGRALHCWKGNHSTSQLAAALGAIYPGELTLADVQYRGCVLPRLLDVIDIPVLWPQPEDFQNRELRHRQKKQWTKRGSMDTVHLGSLLDPPEPLWTTGHSTQHGRNDRVPLDYADARRRIRIQFDHIGAPYTLSVTDYEAEGAAFRQIGANLQCDIPLPDIFLVISLGKPFRDGFCYRLASGILPSLTLTNCAPRPFHNRPLQPHAGALSSPALNPQCDCYLRCSLHAV